MPRKCRRLLSEGRSVARRSLGKSTTTDDSDGNADRSIANFSLGCTTPETLRALVNNHERRDRVSLN